MGSAACAAEAASKNAVPIKPILCAMVAKPNIPFRPFEYRAAALTFGKARLDAPERPLRWNWC
jgi:hypothetical protein